MTTTNETVVERWTYEGVQRDGPDKLIHVWRDPAGTGRTFSKGNLDRFARPGAIYDIHVTLDTEGKVSVKMGGAEKPTYVGMVDDEAHLAILQADSRAEEAAVRVVKQAKADMSRDALAEILAPLKAEYQRRNGVGRRAFLAVILEEMSSL